VYTIHCLEAIVVLAVLTTLIAVSWALALCGNHPQDQRHQNPEDHETHFRSELSFRQYTLSYITASVFKRYSKVCSQAFRRIMQFLERYYL
jgi:hypothetical protein